MEEKLFEFEREVNQELFFQVLGDVYEYVGEHFSFENEIFYMQTYNWGDEEDETPNFYHKPSGFKLWWYKYPMRATECNMEITHKEFLAVLYDCKNSLDKHIKHEINEWWEGKE